VHGGQFGPAILRIPAARGDPLTVGQRPEAARSQLKAGVVAADQVDARFSRVMGVLDAALDDFKMI